MESTINVQNEIKEVRSFILGGNSEFSIENLENEKNYRYKVRQSKDKENLFFVRVKTADGWTYAGFLDTEIGLYVQGRKGSMSASSEPIKGLVYALRKGNECLPRPMVMYHHGRCACCGKKLMDLESTQRGFGPKCWKKITGGHVNG